MHACTRCACVCARIMRHARTHACTCMYNGLWVLLAVGVCVNMQTHTHALRMRLHMRVCIYACTHGMAWHGRLCGCAVHLPEHACVSTLCSLRPRTPAGQLTLPSPASRMDWFMDTARLRCSSATPLSAAPRAATSATSGSSTCMQRGTMPGRPDQQRSDETRPEHARACHGGDDGDDGDRGETMKRCQGWSPTSRSRTQGCRGSAAMLPTEERVPMRRRMHGMHHMHHAMAWWHAEAGACMRRCLAWHAWLSLTWPASRRYDMHTLSAARAALSRSACARVTASCTCAASAASSPDSMSSCAARHVSARHASSMSCAQVHARTHTHHSAAHHVSQE